MSEAVPSPAPVLELLEAFRCSQVLFAGVSLGAFDVLEAGPARLEDLARKLSAQPDALGRLLDTCVGLGLLRREGERYANAPVASTYLVRTSPRRLTGYLNYSNRVLWKLWAHLDDAVREGTNRWKQGLGLDGPLFTSFFRNEDDKREFILGMHGFGQISSPEVVKAFDLAEFRRLVDLGGATGHLAVAACRRYPHLRAAVFDLPEVLPLARELLAGEEVADRIELVAGDFFTDVLPPADLYAVGRILHDWPDDKVQRLLGAIHRALPEGGALLVGEKMLDDDRAGPRWAQLQSLNMLVCAEGKERTLGEYTALLSEAGFRDVQGRRTASPLDAVLARK
jgi:acetylserotonin N-methyltransferase